jgi:hypothetical protein
VLDDRADRASDLRDSLAFAPIQTRMMFVCNCLNLGKMPSNSPGPKSARVRTRPRRNARKQPVCTRGDGVCVNPASIPLRKMYSADCPCYMPLVRLTVAGRECPRSWTEALLRLAHQDVRHTASSTPTGIQLRAVRIPKNQLAGCIGTVQHDGGASWLNPIPRWRSPRRRARSPVMLPPCPSGR